MIVKKVELSNVTSYERGAVEFEKGINAIVGPNGSGKSSIVDALLLATIGMCTRAEDVARNTISRMVRAGEERGAVKVWLEIGGREYRLERVLETQRSSQPRARLFENEKQVAEGSAVCERLSQLLGIKDVAVLTATMISRQGYLAEIIELTPAKRKEAVLELAGLQRLEELRESLKEELRRLESLVMEAEKRGRELDQKKEERRREEEELEKEDRRLRELEERGRSIKRELEEEGRREKSLEDAVELARRREERKRVERELEEVMREISSLPIHPEKHERLVESARRARAELEYALQSLLRAEREAAESLQGKKLVEEELLQQVLRRRPRDLQELLESLWLEGGEEQERRWLEGLERAAKSLGGVQEAVKEMERRKRELSQRIGELEAERKLLSSVVLSATTASCPLCGSPLTPEKVRALAEERRERMKSIERELEQAREELERISEEAEKMMLEGQQVARRLARAREERERAREMLAAFSAACSELAALYGTILGRASECPQERAARDLERAKALSVKRAERERRLTELTLPAEGPERSLSELEEELKGVKRRREELQGELAKAMKEIGMLVGSIERRRENLKRLEEEISRIEAEVKAAEGKKEVLDAVTPLVNQVLGKDGLLARELTRELRGALERNVNEILEDLDRDFKVSVSEEFEIEVIRSGARGGDVRLDVRSLSGGERTMLAIAVRLGLAKALEVPVDFMILDEPTEFLDDEARGKVFDIIPNLMDRLSQIIVITHDPEVEERADRVIRVTKPGTRSIVELG
ncbi:MAG: SMC family ATPase [Acidilobaceae archaeon]